MDGLAMSSRNLRLNDEERKKALLLFESMNEAKNRLLEGQAWREVKESVLINFEREKHTQLEYFELVNPDSFELYGEFNPDQKSSICIAAFVGEVRLIDNLPIIP